MVVTAGCGGRTTGAAGAGGAVVVVVVVVDVVDDGVATGVEPGVAGGVERVGENVVGLIVAAERATPGAVATSDAADWLPSGSKPKSVAVAPSPTAIPTSSDNRANQPADTRTQPVVARGETSLHNQPIPIAKVSIGHTL